MPLSVLYHPHTWKLKPHISANGLQKYLQDMDAKLQWIYEKAKGDDKFKFVKAKPLAWSDYQLVHNADYVTKIRLGKKSEIQKYSWITWSKSFLRAQLYAGGVLYEAARSALKEGVAGAIMVEGHHAQYSYGSGFCTFNHLSVVAKKLINHKLAPRIAIVDLDYHLGDGTIELLSDIPDVSIFDMHGGIHKTVKFRPKSRGRKNVVLKKIDRDWAEYKIILENELPKFLNESKPDIVFYIAGGDIYQNDRYGGIKGTDLDAVRLRDQFVIRQARMREIPVVFSLGGGYVKYTGNKKKDKKSRINLTGLHIGTLLEASNISKFK